MRFNKKLENLELSNRPDRLYPGANVNSSTQKEQRKYEDLKLLRNLALKLF